MTDAEARDEIESRLPLCDAGLGTSLVISPEAARHCLLAIEDRAALCAEQSSHALYDATETARRHMEGRE